MLKFFKHRSKVGKRSRSRSCGQNICYHQKGLDVRNTHASFESPMSEGKTVMCGVKVFQMKIKGHRQAHVLKIYSIIGKVFS